MPVHKCQLFFTWTFLPERTAHPGHFTIDTALPCAFSKSTHPLLKSLDHQIWRTKGKKLQWVLDIHNMTLCIVQHKNSHDIIEFSTIGSKKNLCGEINVKVLFLYSFFFVWKLPPLTSPPPSMARLHSDSNLMFISVWQLMLVWRQLLPAMKSQNAVTDCRHAGRSSSFTQYFHPTCGEKSVSNAFLTLYPCYHRPRLSSFIMGPILQAKVIYFIFVFK